MAIYEINGQRFEVPDSVQGAQLEQTLTQLSEQATPITTGEAWQKHDPNYDASEEARAMREMVAPSGFERNLMNNGIMLGWGQELEAALGAGGLKAKSLFTGDQVNFGDAYRDLLEAYEGRDAEWAEENPGTAIAGELLGAAGTGGASLARQGVVRGGSSTLRATGRGAGAGAAGGAVYGAGTEAPGERIEGGAEGAVIGAAGGGAASGIIQKGKNMLDARHAILEKIRSGSTDNKTARYIESGAGKLRRDPKAIESIKQGFDEGVVAAVKGSTPTDQRKMLQMVNILDKGLKDKKFSVRNRATDVVGDSIVSRVKAIKGANREAAKNLDGVAKSLKGRQVDVMRPVNEFVGELQEGLGVKFNNGKLDFRGSSIEGLDGPQRFLERLVDRMKNTRAPDAYDVHRMKRFIDEQVTFGKTAEGLTGKTEVLAKKLRRSLDQTLDNQFPEYNRVNTQYADTRGVLDDFQKAAGGTIDIFSPNADKSIGTLSRRLMSNAQSRVRLMDSLDDLQQTAQKYAGKSSKMIGDAPFEDDIVTQVMFADELDRVFGPAAKTSLQGEAGKAFESGANTARGGLTDMAVKAGAKGLDAARGINEENAINALKGLLNRGGQ